MENADYARLTDLLAQDKVDQVAAELLTRSPADVADFFVSYATEEDAPQARKCVRKMLRLQRQAVAG